MTRPLHRKMLNRVSTGLSQSHIAWVTDVMKRMQTVKAGMTRSELLGRPRDSQGRVIHTEGGQDTIIKISGPYLAFSVMD